MTRKIKDLFSRPPARELEEVEKVNATEHLKRDIREFYETDSAREALEELSKEIRKKPESSPRFLYIHATFGAGKTLLMKLVGLTTGGLDIEDSRYLIEDLTSLNPGFGKLRQELLESHIDALKPVFLNLLDRDTSQEPPLPLMVYEAIGRELGYPTDPRWLLEFAWQLDHGHDLWKQVLEIEHEGKKFSEVLEKRGSIRSWLYEALPECEGVEETPLSSEEMIKEEIRKAEATVFPDEFNSENLVERLKQFKKKRKDKSGENHELLIGLDEVALFIGENQKRYREFVKMMESLFSEVNMPVIGTGQWSLEEIHKDFEGEAEKDSWYTKEVGLEAAETEIIVQKRWLQKDQEGRELLENKLQDEKKFLPSLVDDSQAPESDSVETYPFKRYDLRFLRQVMKKLITKGRPTEKEYIQGRALLVLVRSLFTEFDWDDREIGELVPWNVLYDLLVQETTYVPIWIRDEIKNLEVDFEKEVVKTAKTLFLLNKTEKLPETPRNIAKLLADHVDENIDEREEQVKTALDALQNYIHEEKEDGVTVYKLLSEQAVDVVKEVDHELQHVSKYQLRAKIQELLRREDEKNLLLAEDSRKEKDIRGENNLPVKIRYSILTDIDPNPDASFDALVVRLSVSEGNELEERVENWREINSKEKWLEDVLVNVEISPSLEERLRRWMAMGKVLDRKATPPTELEDRRRDLQKKIEESVRESLETAEVYTVGEKNVRGQYHEKIENILVRESQKKFPDRKSLEGNLREIDDAREMAQFFEGNKAAWPLKKEDRSMLIGQSVSPEISGGWSQELIEKYEDQVVVSGETLLTEIRDRSGDYNGSSREALAATILCLTTSREVGMRKDGEAVLEPAEMGRSVRTQKDIERTELRPGEGFDKSEVEKLSEVCESLKGFRPSNQDPDALTKMISDWARENLQKLKNVNKKLKVQFEKDEGIENLVEVLEPAMKGGKLGKDELLKEEVIKQAEGFKRGKGLFLDEEPSLWECFTEKRNLLEEHYPDHSLTQKMREIEPIPKPNDLRQYSKEAGKLRSENLTQIYENLTGEEKTFENTERALESLKDWLNENIEIFLESCQKIKSKFGEQTSWDSVCNIANAVEKSELKDEMLGGKTVLEESESFRKAQDLLKEREGGSILENLSQELNRLKEEHPESPTTDKIESVVEDDRLLTVEEAEKLLEEAENPEKKLGTKEESQEDRFERIWKEIREKAEEDNFVLIRSEEDSK